jgi:hypothetical protein
MFNYYFDADRDAHADTVTLFEKCAAGKYDAYTSDYALEELERTADTEKRDKMLDPIERYSITVPAKSDEANELADKYIAEGALPPGSLTDARHIANVYQRAGHNRQPQFPSHSQSDYHTSDRSNQQDSRL